METKTCKNCAHYIELLYGDNTFFHIHDYCAAWETTIPYTHSDCRAFDDKEYCKSVDCDECPHGLSDIENGKAVCWMWEDRSELDKELKEAEDSEAPNYNNCGDVD